MAKAATLKSDNPQAPPHTAAEDAARAPLPPRAFAMLSHRGRIRRVNEDACAALPDLGAFVVCDGIGGAAGGEIASHLAAEAFLHSLSQIEPRHVPPAPKSGNPDDDATHSANHPHTRLPQAVHAANQAVFRHSRKSPSLRGMGTTLVAALWDEAGPTIWLAHVGDSRCYRLSHGILKLLTEDHSLVEEQVRAGTLSRAQAATSPIRNIITRAVGTAPAVEPEIAAHPAESGDLYLLTSDGLTRELDDAEIGRLLIQHLARAITPPLESACQALIDAANAHGGNDNITVLLIACP